MLLYLIIIGIGMVIIAAINILLNTILFNLAIYHIVLAVIYNTVAVFLIDALFAFLIRRLPKKWFHHDNKLFQVSKGERKFYDLIRVNVWKDKILELGQFTDFSKRKAAHPFDNKYVSQFLLECNYGFIIHFACVIFGFLIIFINPLSQALMFAVPVAAVNAFLHYLPMCVLRFNVPKLLVLFKRNERNEKLKSKMAVLEPLPNTDASL